MKLNTSVFFVLASLLSLPAMGALPPYYESVRELTAVLQSSDVAAKLGSGRPISSMSRDGDTIQIVAGDCALPVEIRYLAPEHGIAGPARFELKVGEASCLPRP